MTKYLWLTIMCVAASAHAQQNPDDDFQVLHVRGPVYMIAGAKVRAPAAAIAMLERLRKA